MHTLGSTSPHSDSSLISGLSYPEKPVYVSPWVVFLFRRSKGLCS